MVRIFGFRHKWVNSIRVHNKDGKYFDSLNRAVHLVAIQQPRRLKRIKKTIYVYTVGRWVYQADDPVLDYIIPITSPDKQATWFQVFTEPTVKDKKWLANYNYVLVSDQANV